MISSSQVFTFFSNSHFHIYIESECTFAITCSLENHDGPPHDKKYVSSVQIPTIDGILYIEGDEKL